MKTNVYIDGFNLYYRALKTNRELRWLNIQSMCEGLLTRNDVQSIKYFTAKVRGGKHNPGIARRQEVYLRALETLPKVSIILGRYQEHKVRMGNANPPPATVEVIKREEKGSDVNIASHLLLDAFRDEADAFVVISNDSDLKEPLRMVREDLNKVVGLVTPGGRTSQDLLSCNPTFKKSIRAALLKRNQLPENIQLPSGAVIYRPETWT